MSDHRFLDISDEGLRVRASSNRLLLGRGGETEIAATIPMNDLDAMVLAHRETTVSSAALAGLAKAGCGVVVCDEKRMPVGMFVPLTGHSTQSERFRAQADASLPVRKRLWRDVIRAKIRNQGTLLHELHGDDGGLLKLSGRVKSGDPENIEGQAAARYWRRIFPARAKPFVRNRDADDENALLNYGYSILRSSTARAICAAGLHPGLGIHHHNRYDAYCLADDLMEPFRPLVDGVVAAYLREYPEAERRVDAAFKTTLVFEMGSPLRVRDERRVLFDILARLASSLAAVFLGEREELELPYLRAPLLAAATCGDVDYGEEAGE